MKAQLLHWAAGGGAAIALSAAARALPAPEPMGSKLYQFFFNFTHAMLANFDRINTKG